MKVEAKGPFVAVRVCWENIAQIRELSGGRAIEFSSTNVPQGSEDEDKDGRISEQRPFMVVKISWKTGFYSEANQGEFLVFGQEDAINIFTKHEFQANFREIPQ